MTQGDTGARRLALALLRLQEAGDHPGAAVLAAGLTVDELREALHAQTQNVSLLFELVFVGEVQESHLPGLAQQHGRSRHDVIADYLERLILRFALAEAEQK